MEQNKENKEKIAICEKEKLKLATNNKKGIKIINNLIIYIFEYILFLISVILYLLSLEGCFRSFNECSNSEKYLRKYFNLGTVLVFSSFIFGTIIMIQIVRKIRKINFFIFCIIFLIIFYYSQGTDFAHHGTYNNIIFILFSPIFALLEYFLYLFLFFCLNFDLKKLAIIALLLIYIIMLLKTELKCLKFYDGIGNIRLVNDQKLDFCYIPKPKICGKDLLSGFFDINFYRRKSCEGFNNQKKIFLKYLDQRLKKYNNFSYPRTEYWNPKKSYRGLAKLVEKGINPVIGNNSQNKEIFVSFKEGRGKIQIYLKKNKTLIQKKKKISEKYSLKFNNIYLIYIDGISRRHFIRKLIKTSKLIEKSLYTNNKKNGIYKNFNSFQFFKFHNFDGHTKGNILPIFYGNRDNSKNKISILKYFNAKGFITAAAHNSCNKEIFDWYNYKYTSFSHYDHENVALFCDPNFEDKNDQWSIKKGKCSILRKCFYDRDSFDYNFEYILQFLDAYKNERKLFRISFGDGHEATTEVIKYIDDSLHSFLKNIFEKYYDEKSALIIFSDHGAQIPGPYDILFYEEKMFEKYFGLLIFIIPKNTVNETNIFYNQQKLITLYDVHDTLLHMININKYINLNNIPIHRHSLFLKINGKRRNCKNYFKEIKYYCFCYDYNYKNISK